MEYSAANLDEQSEEITRRLKGYVNDDLLQTYQSSDESLARRRINTLLKTAKEGELEKLKPGKSKRKRFGDFAKLVDDFLTAVIGPADIIKGIPMNLGNVVNGVLVLLVKVAAEKQKQDDLISEALVDVTSWLRRMDNLQASYGSIPEEFNKLVSNIYNKIIDFLCISIRRFSSRGWTRVTMATLRPIEIKEATNALKDSIADLFQEHSAHQSRQITNLERHLSEVRSHGMNKTKADFRQSRNLAIFDTAVALRLPPEMDISNMLKVCSDAHNSLPRYKKIQQNGRLRRNDLVWGGIKSLETRETYRAWIKNEKSCLLLLNGKPYMTPDPQYSWLSPITTELYHQLMSGLSAKTLFFSGHQISGQEIKREDRYAHILWGIAMQALQLELELADDYLNDSLGPVLRQVTAKANEETSKNGKLTADKQLRFIRETLIAAIKQLRLEQPLYIILDGVVWEQDQPQRLAIELAGLVLEFHDELTSKDSQCNKVPIKVLAVAKYDQWRTLAPQWRKDMERAFPHRQMDLKACIIDDLDWCQERA